MPVSRIAVVLMLAFTLGCGSNSTNGGNPGPTPTPNPTPTPSPTTTWPLSDAKVQTLLAQKVFFGHQSVGGNVIAGIQDLMTADSRLKLNLVHSSDPASVTNPALVEYSIGANGYPQLKDSDFASIISNGYGLHVGIAMYKYCYIDITDSTDVQQLFNAYRSNIDTLHASYPLLKIIPITVPITTDPSIHRNTFNKLLREAYAGTPIFDLAEAESTHADGTRSQTIVNGEVVYTLAAEYTADGGHLNEAGRQAAAKKLLMLLAGL